MVSLIILTILLIVVLGIYLHYNRHWYYLYQARTQQPHEVFPEILQWRPGDRLKIHALINSKTAIHPKGESLYCHDVFYKTVTQEGELVCTKTYSDDIYVFNIYRLWSKIHNKDLQDRKEEQIQEKLSEIEKGYYPVFLEETQKEVSKLNTKPQ